MLSSRAAAVLRQGGHDENFQRVCRSRQKRAPPVGTLSSHKAGKFPAGSTIARTNVSVCQPLTTTMARSTDSRSLDESTKAFRLTLFRLGIEDEEINVVLLAPGLRDIFAVLPDEEIVQLEDSRRWFR